jgi:hypothetical protein
MLRAAHQHGIDHALARFNLKTANFLDQLKHMAVGDAGKHFVQGVGAFQKGQPLNYRNVLWPAVAKAKGGHWMNWLTRANTAMLPLAAYQAYKAAPEGHPGEAALGALGSTLGSAYGFAGGGMLGESLAPNALGHVGRTLGAAIDR